MNVISNTKPAPTIRCASAPATIPKWRTARSGGHAEQRAVSKTMLESREWFAATKRSPGVRDLAGLLLQAQEEERRRIARELHDDFNQRLAAHAIAISNLKRSLSEKESALREELGKLEEDAIGLSDEIRMVSHALNAPTLERLGLVAALRALGQEFGALTGLEIEVRAPRGDWRVRPDLALCFYRVAQEGLRNVHTHARATRVEINLSICGGRMEMELSDNGRGMGAPPAARAGMGMMSMEERARLLHGEFHVENAREGGTILKVTLPVDEI